MMKPETNANATELLFKLPTFEGPLDLLLHLIKKNKMDIYDIQMAEITAQYIAYLHQLKELQLDVAGEYLVIASMLVNIKSKMLLPNERLVAEEETEPEDPRDELVQQLILHQTFQKAAENMRGYADERAKLYQREQALLPPDARLGQLDPDEADLEQLQRAFAKLMLKKRIQVKSVRKVEPERYLLKDQIKRVKMLICTADRPLDFEELFEADADLELIVTTFLALLELVKQGDIKASQEQNLGPIKLVGGKNNAI
ncbi:segregation/condensation protein A [Ligilactobacillus faecis]|uniref:Segregation and condensation protein A n=2 Tax=Ligilactobacillus faecis TaxID=762833 RepID=A0ABV4DQH4_9LACO